MELTDSFIKMLVDHNIGIQGIEIEICYDKKNGSFRLKPLGLDDAVMVLWEEFKRQNRLDNPDTPPSYTKLCE